MKDNSKTIVIDNFSGKLTRKINGDMNSGYAKFDTTYGADPFTKPGNLTWYQAVLNYDVPGDLNGLVIAGKTRFESGTNYMYVLTNTGKLYKQQAGPGNGFSLLTTLAASAPTFLYGGSIEFFGATQKIYVGCDGQVNSVNFDGTGEALVGTKADYTDNVFRPLILFAGSLVFGNGNNIGLIDSTGSVSSTVVSSHYEQLSPSLPINQNIRDMDVSIDGNYLLMSASEIPSEKLALGNDVQNALAGESYTYRWNGSDTGVTAATYVSPFAVSALQTFKQAETYFAYDAFGGTLSDQSGKQVSLFKNKSPLPNTTEPNGNFITWMNPEYVFNLDTGGRSLFGSLYYYGNLDNQSDTGLYRLARIAGPSGGIVYQIPFQKIVTNYYTGGAADGSQPQIDGYGTHVFSYTECQAGTITNNRIYYFHVTPVESTSATTGVYETQTQLFGEKISIEGLRVYCEPTIASNAFQVDLIGGDGLIVNNGTYTYTYAAGTDVTKMQGALERINFDTSVKNLYALGLRITNTGTTQMTIKKVEVDWSFQGK